MLSYAVTAPSVRVSSLRFGWFGETHKFITRTALNMAGDKPVVFTSERDRKAVIEGATTLDHHTKRGSGPPDLPASAHYFNVEASAARPVRVDNLYDYTRIFTGTLPAKLDGTVGGHSTGDLLGGEKVPGNALDTLSQYYFTKVMPFLKMRKLSTDQSRMLAMRMGFLSHVVQDWGQFAHSTIYQPIIRQVTDSGERRSRKVSMHTLAEYLAKDLIDNHPGAVIEMTPKGGTDTALQPIQDFPAWMMGILNRSYQANRAIALKIKRDEYLMTRPGEDLSETKRRLRTILEPEIKTQVKSSIVDTMRLMQSIGQDKLPGVRFPAHRKEAFRKTRLA